MDKNYGQQGQRSFIEYDQASVCQLFLMRCGIEHSSPVTNFGPRALHGYSLTMVLSGEGSALINGEEFRNIHSGQMFLIRPGDTVDLSTDPDHPWTCCWMTFDGSAAASLMEDAGFTEGVKLRNCYIDIVEFLRLTEAVLSHTETDPGAWLWRHGLLCQFVALTIASNRRNPGSNLYGRENSRRSHRCYIDHAMEFINSNYAIITIEDIAGYLGIHRSYLSKLFREQMHCTPNECLLRCRMKHGAKLLADTELTIREIGESVGYDDPLTFSKAFKRCCGVSPKFYRQLSAEEREKYSVFETEE